MNCSEAIWQRCWASASDAKLRVGAVWGAAQVSLVVFIFGFGGFLAVWGGLWVPSGPDDPGNTILFALLQSQGMQASCEHAKAQPSRLRSCLLECGLRMAQHPAAITAIRGQPLPILHAYLKACVSPRVCKLLLEGSLACQMLLISPRVPSACRCGSW